MRYRGSIADNQGMLPLMLLRSRISKPTAKGLSEVGARSAAENVIQPLERRVESLELACASMWELLKSKLNMSDEDILAVMAALDTPKSAISLDDERETEEICVQCGKRVLTKRGFRCLWCGAELPRGPFGQSDVRASA